VSAAGQWGTLERHLRSHRGQVPVVLHIEAADGSMKVTPLAADRYGVDPCPELGAALTGMLGQDSYALRAAEGPSPLRRAPVAPEQPAAPAAPAVLPFALERHAPRREVSGSGFGL
jgi:hypothetical protein